MKRFLFIFIVFFSSVILIYGTIKLQKTQDVAKSNKDLEEFLNYETGIYSYDDSKKDFSLKDSNSNLKYYLISSVDGIYFQSTDSEPIKIQKIGDETNINIGKGIYIFVLNDIFEKYKINGENFSVKQLGKGIFFVSNIAGDYKIYSFNAILNVSLNELNKEIVNFELFPGLLFKYNPEYNLGLVGSDIIRISTVNSIAFLNSKSPNFAKNLDIQDLNFKIGEFIKKSLLDITSRYKKNQNVYQEVLKLKIEEIAGIEYINEYNSLLNNNSKKDVYYKNQILIYFLNILKSDNDSISLQKNKDNLSKALNNIKEYSNVAYEDGIDLLKSYYYLAYYSNNLNDKTSFDGNISKNNIDKTIKDIFKDNIAGVEYFSELSEVFFAYNFTGFTRAQIDEYINNYLKELKRNNTLKEKDFLNFTFFLTQYSLSSNNISKDSLNILVQLIDIFNSYYSILKDDDKKNSAATMQFYNFSKIIGNVVNNILSIYFEKRSGNIVLKENYTKVVGDQIESAVGSEITETIGLLFKNGINDLNKKKENFYISTGKQNLLTKDNFSLLEEKYKKLGYIYNQILIDYNAYFTKFKLSAEERNTNSEEKDNTFVLSEEDLRTYLQKFNQVDFGSLKIINFSTMNSDRYYLVEVYMFQKKFKFKLFPDPKDKHSISDVEYENINGNIIKDDLLFSLDQKEEDYLNLDSPESDPIKRQKYDFKYFFSNSYLTPSDSGDNGKSNAGQIINPEINESSAISIFKQNKLLDGDFTYINDFIKIPFNSIKVKIDNGKYIISIDKVYNVFRSNDNNFNCELEMAYIFTEHNFQNISLRVTQEDLTNGYQFDGKYINIIPAKISHKEFSKKLKNIGKFLTIIQQNYSSTATSLKIDLNLSKVFIDSKSFDVNITQ